MHLRKYCFPIASVLLVISLVFTSGCVLTVKNPVESGIPTITEPTNAATYSGLNTTSIVPVLGSQPALPSIADVVAKVKPSVVAINVKATVVTSDIFGRQYQQVQQGAGSGWIISSDGIIVTNNHVVEGATSIQVTLEDGTPLSVDVKTVKSDTVTDLAILKVDVANLPAVQLGDSSKLREGDWVIAIGNSLGKGTRVTQGIVSRRNVSLEVGSGQTLEGLIETDALINPGNSGGPLVNMAGQVIGITNAKNVQTGVEGVAYAISVKTAVPIIQELINKGYIVRPYFGVNADTVDDSVAFWNGLKVNHGAIITAIGVNTPAAASGLKVNDVIVKFNGQDINDGPTLVNAIHQTQIGQEVDIVYYRGSAQRTTKATMVETLPAQ